MKNDRYLLAVLALCSFNMQAKVVGDVADTQTDVVALPKEVEGYADHKKEMREILEAVRGVQRHVKETMEEKDQPVTRRAATRDFNEQDEVAEQDEMAELEALNEELEESGFEPEQSVVRKTLLAIAPYVLAVAHHVSNVATTVYDAVASVCPC